MRQYLTSNVKKYRKNLTVQEPIDTRINLTRGKIFTPPKSIVVASLCSIHVACICSDVLCKLMCFLAKYCNQDIFRTTFNFTSRVFTDLLRTITIIVV